MKSLNIHVWRIKHMNLQGFYMVFFYYMWVVNTLINSGLFILNCKSRTSGIIMHVKAIGLFNTFKQ